MARPKNEEDKPLTDTEIQIMNVIWEQGSGTVHEVIEQLKIENDKDYAYTTVSTMLRILEKKQALSSVKEGRGHRYTPKIKQEGYQKKAAKHLLKNVFQGQRTRLIKNLLGSAKISKDELNEIKKLIDEKTRND